MVDNGLAGEFRHTHYAVGIVHSVFLYAIDSGVHLSSRAVEIGGMDMDAQRFAAHALGMDACGIGEPVVGMDYIKLLGACYDTRNDAVVVYLLVKVAGIAACKLHTPKVVDVHIIEVSIYMLAQTIVVVGRHDVSNAVLHIVIVYVAPCYGHRIHGNYACGMLFFVAERMWQAQSNLDVALRFQTFRYTVIGCGESSEYVWRILPSEH